MRAGIQGHDFSGKRLRREAVRQIVFTTASAAAASNKLDYQNVIVGLTTLGTVFQVQA